MMKEPKELSSLDFPHTTMVPDGYDMRSVPEATKENFEALIEEHNKLVKFVHKLAADIRALEY